MSRNAKNWKEEKFQVFNEYVQSLWIKLLLEDEIYLKLSKKKLGKKLKVGKSK